MVWLLGLGLRRPRRIWHLLPNKATAKLPNWSNCAKVPSDVTTTTNSVDGRLNVVPYSELVVQACRIHHSPLPKTAILLQLPRRLPPTTIFIEASAGLLNGLLQKLPSTTTREPPISPLHPHPRGSIHRP